MKTLAKSVLKCTPSMNFIGWRDALIELYNQYLNINIAPALERFVWPHPRKKDFDRFIYCPEKLSANDLAVKLYPGFNFHLEIEADKFSEERYSFMESLVLCRTNSTPDERWQGYSGYEAAQEKTSFLGIRELIVLDATHFLLTNEHLEGVTICPRSRDNHDLKMAVGYFNEIHYLIDGHPPVTKFPDRGPREAIVLKRK